MFEYDEDSMKAVEILDTYDFTDILMECRGIDIYDVKMWFSDINDEIEEAVDNLTIDELYTYLEERYGMHTEDIIKHCMFWNKYSKKRY